ncbi:Isochorismatase hydrolase [Favolaschia claudopus]|uniref:Isochorismatase hydrolase n=1 Tax=Favolaschia claudopus TaxID=2862362 RepID=A0AAW0DWZ9_9AGAR
MPAPDALADSESNARRVLLCLDIQAGVLSAPPKGVPSANTLRQNLAAVLAAARGASQPPLIIHVRNAGDFGDVDEPSSTGWQLVHTPLQNEPVVDKRKNNAFASTKLGDLIPLDAEIVIVGLQSDFSVRATCSAALGRGNEVLLIHGAHGTYDRLEVLYGGGITPAAQIEEEIEGELQEAGVHLLEMKDLSAIFDDR